MGLIRREVAVGLLTLQREMEWSHWQEAIASQVALPEQAECAGMIRGLDTALAVIEMVEEEQTVEPVGVVSARDSDTACAQCGWGCASFGWYHKPWCPEDANDPRRGVRAPRKDGSVAPEGTYY
jgi:hypothetical protein